MKFERVNEKLFRGSQPDGPQFVDLLKTNGIDTVIDLEGSFWERFSRESEAEINNAFKNRYRIYVVPLSAFFPPSRAQVRHILNIISFEKCTFIHCAKGEDRTGAISACSRVRFEDWSPDRAIEEMWEKGFHWWYAYWIPFLRAIMKELIVDVV